MEDYLFRGSLAELDPAVNELTQLEAERQFRKLIMVPSESTAPLAVRTAMGSAFQNIYAEGYPEEETRWYGETEILDFPTRLAEYRRYSDPRYYKGVEYADIIEALARRRCAEAFANNGVTPSDLYVNVQALSGAPANNAVYHALVEPGATILGMSLLHGGHLSHGSSVNRSGKFYNAIHYTVDPLTEKINYDQVASLAQQHKPKIIIAGYSSYPWAVDWRQFQEISRSVGAYLFADIAHVAGLVAGGAFPSPIGYADVITFTTHKSLCGPRGACILTTDASLARKIDKAVFPGEQGGPHVNIFAAMALTFKLAQSEQFRALQHQIVKNCIVLTEQLRKRGFRIPFGGTNTHLTNLDCKSVVGPDGTTLSGDQAARILDLAGIVVNRNTIPGDKSAVNPSGIRLGTPWVTQRGLGETEMVEVADLIADLLLASKPYSLPNQESDAQRAKVDFELLETTKIKVRLLAEKAGIDYVPSQHGYPHFYYWDDKPTNEKEWVIYELNGKATRQFLNYVVTSDIDALQSGESLATVLLVRGKTISGWISYIEKDHYRLGFPATHAGEVAAWLRALSDGYVAFDSDLLRKLPGPITITESSTSVLNYPSELEVTPRPVNKPYYIGISKSNLQTALPDFYWQEKETPLRRTPIFSSHQRLGAKMIPFAGWEMPVWYTSVLDEHLTVRQAAGLFDVTHMGVYEVSGESALAFLDSVVANDVSQLKVGESLYTHLLDPSANVLDDLLIYRRGALVYLLVVNASNDDKDWAWLNAVLAGTVKVENDQPSARVYGRGARLRNLRDPREGKDQRVDIALQGPRSRDVLLALGGDADNHRRIKRLKRTELCEAHLGGFDLVVSRTGYTGEKMAFELFVHPDSAEELFNKLLAAGEPFGLKPCGLGARDSLRTEAGLPLYGHEMAGEKNLGVAEAGFGAYVKTYKSWFIGRQAFLQREAQRKGVVVRFRFNEKGVRMAHSGDPVVDKRGRVVGWVTSCAVDSQGYLTGQVYVDLNSSTVGTPIHVFQSATRERAKAPAELQPGDRIILPSPATVVNRFMQ